MERITVWDWPVRVFHWLIVVLFSGLIITGKAEEDYMQWHFYFGYALSAVLIARVIYGFVGSKYAKFLNFIYGPKTVLAYLQGAISGKKKVYLGHNPLGGLMVIVMLLLLCLQWLTGLISSDDVFWFGPFYEWVSEELQELGVTIHHSLPNILLLLVALHICAVLTYEIALKERLIGAMITGRKRLSNYQDVIENQPAIKTPRIGMVLSLVISLIWLFWLWTLPI